MPTGYTADVVDGKITTLKEFALRCARGMGATIMMRDEPWDAPIPEKFEPSTKYYDDSLTKAKATLAEIEILTPSQCDERASKDFEDRMASYEKYQTERQVENNRLRDMIEKVEEWSTEADGIREFMLEQLRISISDYKSPAPKKMTGEEWLSEARQEALWSISYHEEQRTNEINRTEMRNQWLAKLHRSLECVS